MRVAYLILAHEQPRHLRRLIGALSSASSAAFIHLDRKSRLEDFSAVAGPSVHIARERVPVYRYHFSHIEAAMILLRMALTDDRHFDYFVLLSGTDYPLQSAHYIEDFLERHRGTEFMNIVPIPCEAAGKPTWRLTTYKPNPGAPRIVRSARRLLAKAGAVSTQRDYDPHLEGLMPYGGSEWWALTRSSCAHLLDFFDTSERVVAFFEHVHCPQESFYQTVLGNSPHKANMTRNLTYTDWTGGGASPAWLTERHIELFGSTARVTIDDVYGAGEVLFARKFSDRAEHLVERLDRIVEVRAR